MNINEAKVGMRIKLVHYLDDQEHYGLEGTITAIRFFPIGSECVDGSFLHFASDIEVMYDIASRACSEHSSRVEPILPPNIIQEILDKKELPDEDCPLFQFVEAKEKDAI